MFNDVPMLDDEQSEQLHAILREGVRDIEKKIELYFSEMSGITKQALRGTILSLAFIAEYKEALSSTPMGKDLTVVFLDGLFIKMKEEILSVVKK